MTIKAALLSWDTKSAEDIEGIYQDFFLTSATDLDIEIETLLKLLKDDSGNKTDRLQQGASWLIKHHLQLGQAIKDGFSDALLDGLVALRPWQAKLHLLQCFPYLTFTEQYKAQVEHFLRQCLMDKNKFVRAWAYSGFHDLSLQYPEYSAEVKNFIEQAMKDEAPSVKARLRNMLKNHS
jgi:hypothetical protein